MIACMAAVFAFGPITVHADEIDLSQTGSLTIKVHDGSTPVPGGALTIYKAGDIVKDEDGDYIFVLTDEFAGSKIPLTNTSSRAVCVSLYDYAQNNSIAGTRVTVPDDATVVFKNVEAGLYLVAQTTAADGYEAMAPFLISMPYWSEEEQAYTYDVSAYPKSDPAKAKTSKDTDEPDSGTSTNTNTTTNNNTTNNETTNNKTTNNDTTSNTNTKTETVTTTTNTNSSNTTGTTTANSVNTSEQYKWIYLMGLLVISLVFLVLLFGIRLNKNSSQSR